VGPSLSRKIKNNDNIQYSKFLTKQILTSFHFRLLDESDVLKIVKSLRTKTSCGEDGISVKLLKFISPILAKTLSIIINQSLITGIFPDKLKIAKVFPLYKKEDPLLVDNYRPISLLPSISKVFEKAVYNQLYKYFTDNGLFYKKQFGFRLNHSTELAAVTLADKLLTDLDNGKYPISIFMDLSKAFDTLDHDILLHKLSYYGIRGTELKWFQSYLCNRNQFVEIDDVKSDLKSLHTGVPQGSILGPLLFLIYMNDIPESSLIFDFILYADDTTLSSAAHIKLPSDVKNTETKINKELSNVYNWLAANKLSLNVKKTKFICFHTTKRTAPNLTLNINGSQIEQVQNFNFLGLTIDDTLSWKSHIDRISLKLARYSGIFNNLEHHLPPYIMRTLYCSMVNSTLNYGLLAWGFHANRLIKLQKRIIRIIARSKYNAHTEPIFKALRLLKLTDMFKLNVLKLYYKYKDSQVPDYFLRYEVVSQGEVHSYRTRNTSYIRRNLTRTNLAQKCLRHVLSPTINTFPGNVINKVSTHSYHGFSLYVKNHILDTYSYVCSIPHCYICR
jgi:hypothetical protein